MAFHHSGGKIPQNRRQITDFVRKKRGYAKCQAPFGIHDSPAYNNIVTCYLLIKPAVIAIAEIKLAAQAAKRNFQLEHA
jgi:hypothetical protein